MKVKFLKPYGLHKPGDSADVRETVATLLVGRGVAEEVKSEQQQHPKYKKR